MLPNHKSNNVFIVLTWTSLGSKTKCSRTLSVEMIFMKRNRNIFSYCLQSFVFPLCLLYYYCHYCHTNLSRRPNHSLMCKQFKLGKELKLVCNTIGGIQTEQLQLQVQLLSNSHIKEQPSIHCHQFNQNQATFATAVGVSLYPLPLIRTPQQFLFFGVTPNYC